MDCASRVRRSPAQLVGITSWLRDEEAKLVVHLTRAGPSSVPHTCHSKPKPRRTHGCSRAAVTLDDLRTSGLLQAGKCSPKQPLTSQTRERASNQASNDRCHQRRTPADTDGRRFPGQGRLGERIDAPHSDLLVGLIGRPAMACRVVCLG
jgi:hypothetical protein